LAFGASREGSGFVGIGSIEELAALETPFRFEVVPEDYPLGWVAFTNMSGCEKRILQALSNVAINKGAKLEDWRISFVAIENDKWIGIEYWRAGAWATFAPGAHH
jgi:hypothetical protein